MQFLDHKRIRVPKNENQVPRIKENYGGKQLGKLEREITKVRFIEKL